MTSIVRHSFNKMRSIVEAKEVIAVIMWVMMVQLLAVSNREQVRQIINAGTNYQYNISEQKIYRQLGEHCSTLRINKGNNGLKRQGRQVQSGECKASLFCNQKTNRCDCEDSGEFKYTVQDGVCKNYVGSRCFSTKDCVRNAVCREHMCVCREGKKCAMKKVSA